MKLRAITAIAGAIFMLVSFTHSQAEESRYSFPKGCVGSGFEWKDNYLILNTESGSSQGLYLFHNTSGSEVLLNHPLKDDPGASAGWASMLGAGKWSAFAVNKGDFALSCSVMGRGEVGPLACDKVITACRFENPVFKQEGTGSYWVSENKTLETVLEDTKSRGIGW